MGLAQADLDEAEQQIQEKTDFLKEVQQALEAMAVRFSIDIDVRHLRSRSSLAHVLGRGDSRYYGYPDDQRSSPGDD